MTNAWYVNNILANCDGNLYLPILHLQRVELHCELQETLHRMTGPLQAVLNVLVAWDKQGKFVDKLATSYGIFYMCSTCVFADK